MSARDDRVVEAGLDASAAANAIEVRPHSCAAGADPTPGTALQVIMTKRRDLATLRARNKRMTKADLVGQVADALGGRVTKRDCGLAVDAFLDAVREALARGEGIEIRGFGTFKVRHSKARKARNPRTGEAVEVAARDVPVFQPSKLLRRRVDRGLGVSGAEEALEVVHAP